VRTVSTEKRTVGQRLRRERERLNMTQEQLAQAIEASTLTVIRWEHDQALPRPASRAELCRVFGNSAEALFSPQEPLDDTSHQPLVWQVPHPRNLCFTGREETLAALHRALSAQCTVAPTQPHALTGLGGIGKTQIAIEYAYRFGAEYKAVLWARADSRQALISDFAVLADALDLPEKTEADQRRGVAAVQRWLRGHRRWLLILDNADDVGVSYDFLAAGGAILLTTRSQATGPHITGIEVEKMRRDEGTLLLLRRAKLLAEDATHDGTAVALEGVADRDRRGAEEIWALLDGLPLALDQAAAYVEENQCSFAAYLQRHRAYQADILRWRGTLSEREYPHPVATTWELSFALVRCADPAAAELLRLCAFLHPDAIPEDLLGAGVVALGPLLEPLAADPLRLDAAIAHLRRYSLVRRNAETGTLTIHRLVQAVLRDAMTPESQQAWAERVVHLLNHAFPEPEFAAWPQCERYLSHAQVGAELIERWDLACPEAADLLHRVGSYLYERGQFRVAERPFRRALAIRERVLGPDHSALAQSLSDLALLLMARGKHAEAEALYRRALTIQERVLGPVHPDVGVTLNDLAMLGFFIGNYAEVEGLHQRARRIFEQTLGPTHHNVATSLNNLAKFYVVQGRHEEAERLMRQALAIRSAVQGADHPDVANSLHHLAGLYAAQGKYAEAEPLYACALGMRERSLGSVHPSVAETLDDLARLKAAQDGRDHAEALFQRALAIREQCLGTSHPAVADTLEGYADLLRRVGRPGEAAQLAARAQAMRAHLMQETSE
jgi:tetratricopeptide (TPR) repeat protein/transcriptional regulator with XRE-family HTH domain